MKTSLFGGSGSQMKINELTEALPGQGIRTWFGQGKKDKNAAKTRAKTLFTHWLRVAPQIIKVLKTIESTPENPVNLVQLYIQYFMKFLVINSGGVLTGLGDKNLTGPVTTTLGIDGEKLRKLGTNNGKFKHVIDQVMVNAATATIDNKYNSRPTQATEDKLDEAIIAELFGLDSESRKIKRKANRAYNFYIESTKKLGKVSTDPDIYIKVLNTVLHKLGLYKDEYSEFTGPIKNDNFSKKSIKDALIKAIPIGEANGSVGMQVRKKDKPEQKVVPTAKSIKNPETKSTPTASVPNSEKKQAPAPANDNSTNTTINGMPYKKNKKQTAQWPPDTGFILSGKRPGGGDRVFGWLGSKWYDISTKRLATRDMQDTLKKLYFHKNGIDPLNDKFWLEGSPDKRVIVRKK